MQVRAKEVTVSCDSKNKYSIKHLDEDYPQYQVPKRRLSRSDLKNGFNKTMRDMLSSVDWRQLNHYMGGLH